MEIVLEVQDAERATQTIQRLLKEQQIERIAKVSIKKPKNTKIKVREGDLFCVVLDESLVVVGIILHISNLLKNSILVGFYDQCFGSVEDIDVKALWVLWCKLLPASAQRLNQTVMESQSPGTCQAAVLSVTPPPAFQEAARTR